MSHAEELATLRAKIERLEELTKLQSLALISMWGRLEGPNGTLDDRYSKEIEENLSKVVELFEVRANG